MKLLKKVFYRPLYVFILCCVFLFANLIVDGTLFQVFRLNRDLMVLRNRIVHLQDKNRFVEEKNQKIKRSPGH